MKFLLQLVVQAGLVIVGLLVYDARRPRVEPTSYIAPLAPVGRAAAPAPAPVMPATPRQEVVVPGSEEWQRAVAGLAELNRQVAELQAYNQRLAAENALRDAREASAGRPPVALPAPPVPGGAPPAEGVPGAPAAPADVESFRTLAAQAELQREAERRADAFRTRLAARGVRLSPEQDRDVVAEMLRYQASLPSDPRRNNLPAPEDPEADARRREARETYERALARLAASTEVTAILEVTDPDPLPGFKR